MSKLTMTKTIVVSVSAGLLGASILRKILRRSSNVVQSNVDSANLISNESGNNFQELEINAGDPEETFLVSAQLLRGKIINHFANVEFMFADLHFRAIRLSEYSSLSTNLPYKVKSRIAAVRLLSDIPGPIQAYGDELRAAASEFARFEKLRQFIAHGNMLVDFKQHAPIIIFHVFDQPKGSGPILSERKISLSELHESYMEIAIYSARVIRLFHQIIKGLNLPPAV